MLCETPAAFFKLSVAVFRLSSASGYTSDIDDLNVGVVIMYVDAKGCQPTIGPITFCSRPEATSDVICGVFVGPVITDNRVKLGYLRINLSREIPPEAI